MKLITASRPNWTPLENALPEDRDLGEWMWMHAVDVDGVRVEQYKHKHTRRYLNLDSTGQAWRLPVGGSAERIPFAAALAWALS